MNYSDVKEKHVYYVDYEPTRVCEFNDHHLSIVIKKNADNRTVVVLPMTKSSSGVGVNKHDLGIIKSLPTRLKKKSYAVYDQVRTVNVDRLERIFDDCHSRNVVDVYVENSDFCKVLSLCQNELITVFNKREVVDFYTAQLAMSKISIVVDLAYSIKKLSKIDKKNKAEYIKAFELEIKDLMIGIEHWRPFISDLDDSNGITDIISSCLESNSKYVEKI